MKLNTHSNRVKTPFGDIQFEVDNLFDHVFGTRTNPGSALSKGWTPRVAITESDTTYQMMMELPGVDPASVNLEVQDNQLEISGEKSIPEVPEGTTSIRDERTFGSFHRVFEFNQLVDMDRIEATFENGLLRVDLPKSEAVLPRKIEVKVAN